MRPGYAVILEWGWVPYINNNGTVTDTLRLVEDATDGKIYTRSVTQQMVFNAINRLKAESSGNYDACLGFIKNFGFQARNDGGFNCFTEIVTVGEVIESIKAPNISSYNPFILSLENNSLPRITSSLDPSQAKTITEAEEAAEQLTGLTTEYFTEAVEKNIIPQYNGLEGLTKSLKNYATFNQFTLGNPGQGDGVRTFGTSKINNSVGLGNINPEASSAGFSGDLYNGYNPVTQTELDIIFEDYGFERDKIATGELEHNTNWLRRIFRDEEKNLSNVIGIDEELYENLEFLAPESTNPDRQGGDDVYGWHNALQMEATRFAKLESLLRFQGSTVQSSLMEKLQVENPEELRNYIIPRGGIITHQVIASGSGLYSYEEGDYGVYRNDQPYIRWDALAILINETLIPKDDDSKNPLSIITDRVYDLGKSNGACRLDPLRFASIKDLNEERTEKIVYDFSTDANTCILPLQFYSVESDVIRKQIGYMPKFDNFPKNYIEAIYEKTNIRYNGKPLRDIRRYNSFDAGHRIGSIYLNLKMVDYIATKNNNNPDYTIGKFITDIWDEVNKACPNHNFVLTDDKESGHIFIIDLPVDTDEAPSINDLYEFTPFSNITTLRDFSYTSEVPSALSSTIAIQSQDPRSIQDIDGVTFAAFNRAIKNRLYSNNTTSNWTRTNNAIINGISSQVRTRLTLKERLDDYRYDFFANLSAEANGEEIYQSNIAGTLKEYQQSSVYISEANKQSAGVRSVIPLKFNATLDGISGMVIGNMFKIKKDRLPKAYKNANIAFIIFNESQQITAGGDWTTDISGQMVLLDSPTLVDKLPIKYIIDPPNDNTNWLLDQVADDEPDEEIDVLVFDTEAPTDETSVPQLPPGPPPPTPESYGGVSILTTTEPPVTIVTTSVYSAADPGQLLLEADTSLELNAAQIKNYLNQLSTNAGGYRVGSPTSPIRTSI